MKKGRSNNYLKKIIFIISFIILLNNNIIILGKVIEYKTVNLSSGSNNFKEVINTNFVKITNDSSYFKEKKSGLSNIYSNKINNKKIKKISIIVEFGGGHMVSLGAGYKYNFFNLFNDVISCRYFGFIIGGTYLNEDSVGFLEPSIFLSGKIVDNIYNKYLISLIWRVKIGEMFIRSFQYDINGSVFTSSLDVLLLGLKYYYVNVSFPLVFGTEGTEFAPNIGIGFTYKIF